MKIAIGIIGMMLGLLVTLQSCTVAGAAALGRNAEATQAGQVGIIIGFLFFLGGAFGFGLPLVAGILFIVAALFAFGNTGVFTDMGYWAGAAAILAAMSFWTWRSARKARAASLTSVAAPAPASSVQPDQPGRH